jgi:hypothetical protein
MMVFSGIGITLLAFILAFILAGEAIDGGQNTNPGPTAPPGTNMESVNPIGQYVNENTELELSPIQLDNPKNITMTLTWTDEPDRNFLWTNAPDEFGIRAEGPNGQVEEAPLQANTHGQPGMVTLEIEVDTGQGNWTSGNGNWTVTIIAGDAGNQARRLRPAVIGFVDNGNDVLLAIDYEYYDITDGE